MIPQSRYASRIGIGCIYLMAWTFICCFMILGCGGGSGGSGGDGPNSIAYSGLETPAEITAENANAIAANALETRSASNGFTGIASLSTSGQAVDGSYQPYLYSISQAMKGTMAQMDYHRASDRELSANVQSTSDVMNGACGGNASYDITYDPDTGEFSGKMSFNGFCEEGVSVSGLTSCSGVINVNTLEFESFSLIFEFVTTTFENVSYTLDGRMDFIQSGTEAIATMNVAIQDNALDRICKVQDYQLVITDGYGQTELEISGRFYDPDYGYVDLETETVVTISDADDHPNSGVVILTGELGSAGGATKARLTALSATQCQVEADTNGDGSYDYDSGPMLWTDLDSSV